uniref:long-chain-fatty-acid--CoA ligase n=1 Tax=Romanomermis culicivorax TaxID=13658 RepID=A0A915KIG4_ROMCU
MACGSAPCSPETLTFMRVALGCFIVEGYGCTENTGGASCTLEGDCETGHVGPPCPSNKIKLIQVPEVVSMGIPNAGEVCIFGATVFQSYFKDTAMTFKVIDKDGWLHTGDIGVWTEQGTLKIIGRKNCLFKLPQGEFISPDKIENIYCRSQFIFQIFVYGDNHHDHLVGILIPDFNNLKLALKPILGPKASLLDMCTHEGKNLLAKYERTPSMLGEQGVRRASPSMRGEHARSCARRCLPSMLGERARGEFARRAVATVTLIIHDMQEQARAVGLNQVEQVNKITLHSQAFTVENGLITPTMKLKRMAIAKRFAAEIASMALYCERPITAKQPHYRDKCELLVVSQHEENGQRKRQ